MRKLKVDWTVKQFLTRADKGTVSFDYPIQRAGNQWDLLQKSVLIHTLVEDYPLPSIYSIEEEDIEMGKDGKEKKVKKFQILDGKQRLTNIKDFIEGKYVLHMDTPSATIDGETYQLADKTFDELPEELKDAIESFSITVIKLEEASDEQIEEIFFRLNNGTPLSKQQKAKAKMGAEWAGKIKDIMNHPMMLEKASFTELQKRKADDEMSVLQTMMLLDDASDSEFELKSISSNDVFEYALTIKNDDSKDGIIKKIGMTMDYIDEAFKEKENVILKKVHFPMVIMTALKAIEMEVSPEQFSNWRDDFKLAINDKKKSEISTKYKSFGGAGSVKKTKTMGRIEEMEKHLEAYIEKFGKDATEEKKEIKEEVKPVEKETVEPKVEEVKPVAKEEVKPVEKSENPVEPKAKTEREIEEDINKALSLLKK